MYICVMYRISGNFRLNNNFTRHLLCEIKKIEKCEYLVHQINCQQAAAHTASLSNSARKDVSTPILQA